MEDKHCEQSKGEAFVIDSINREQEEKQWIVPITVNRTVIPFKLDTGAEVNVLPEKEFLKLKGKPKLHKMNTKIISYGGTKIPHLSKCMGTVHYKNVTCIHCAISSPEIPLNKDTHTTLFCFNQERVYILVICTSHK